MVIPLEPTSPTNGDSTLTRVARLLDAVPATRDNYSLLLLMYWLVYDHVLDHIAAHDDVKNYVISQLIDAVTKYHSSKTFTSS